jgi:hypothetical protein
MDPTSGTLKVTLESFSNCFYCRSLDFLCLEVPQSINRIPVQCAQMYNITAAVLNGLS